MHVCMHVCMYACMHVCMCHMYAYMCVRMCIVLVYCIGLLYWSWQSLPKKKGVDWLIGFWESVCESSQVSASLGMGFWASWICLGTVAVKSCPFGTVGALPRRTKQGTTPSCKGKVWKLWKMLGSNFVSSSCLPKLESEADALAAANKSGRQTESPVWSCLHVRKDFLYFRAAFQLAGVVGLSSKCTPFDHRDLSNTYMHHFTNTTIYHISFCMQLRDCSPSYSTWTITKNLWL